MSERQRGVVRAPDFPEGLEWLNVEKPLTLAQLRGKIVLLDFWTFCCINCHHILPELRKLEERFPNELVVIGVHSPKFPAEEETFNVRQAVMRHDIRHPVVNDRGFLLWRAYAARAWPTIVIVGPDGRVLGGHSGEFDAAALGDVLQEIIASAEKTRQLDRTPLPLVLEKWKQPTTLVSFPGKVLADPAGGRLFVADTDHHRILRFDLESGRLRTVYGCGEPGLLDGSAKRARFNSPQGMALHGDALLVADTESHALRRIALTTGTVTTLAGTGEQNRAVVRGPSAGAVEARSAALNSPWDVAAADGTLYLAMAGSHQLWTLDLRAGELRLFAGDGREALADGPRRSARLAQPSGLALDGDRLWFADSETSSIRSVPLEGEGEVKTWIGKGLFDYGDRDGDRERALLQHPLHVAAAGHLVYVADSYNNRIKVLDPSRGMIRTLSGTGEPGCEDGPADRACFWEPGGLSVAGDYLYVADTNNHRIRRVHRETGEVMTLGLSE